MGIITQRRKRRQTARLRRSLLKLTAAVGVIAALAFSSSILQRMEAIAGGIQVFAHKSQREMTLSEYDVYALQLAVFEHGDRAANELKRLQGKGVRCVIWQKEKMRIVADAALERKQLNTGAAKGHDAYVIQEHLEAVSLRLRADSVSIEQAERLLEAPDRLFKDIAQGGDIAKTVQTAGAIAQEALKSNQENALYTQLAQSLLSWSAMMEKLLATADETEARSYGAVTMCKLCRELRQALNVLSTASAQRTPSTAAEVMPPA